MREDKFDASLRVVDDGLAFWQSIPSPSPMKPGNSPAGSLEVVVSQKSPHLPQSALALPDDDNDDD